VSPKLKKKKFHFNLGVLFRWLIFAAIIYFSINYLSINYLSTNYLSTNYSANLNIAGVSTEPLVENATNLFEKYKTQTLNFINDQYIELKKQIITKVYEDIINNIEGAKK